MRAVCVFAGGTALVLSLASQTTLVLRFVQMCIVGRWRRSRGLSAGTVGSHFLLSLFFYLTSWFTQLASYR